MAQILVIEDNMDGYEICRILKKIKIRGLFLL